MVIKRKCLPPNVLEMICNILGDTNRGLTGTEIHRFLLCANIEDIEPSSTKRHRLFQALIHEQSKNKCSNQILIFIGYALAPSRFIDRVEEFTTLRQAVNKQLAFVGYELYSTLIA